MNSSMIAPDFINTAYEISFFSGTFSLLFLIGILGLFYIRADIQIYPDEILYKIVIILALYSLKFILNGFNYKISGSDPNNTAQNDFAFSMYPNYCWFEGIISFYIFIFLYSMNFSLLIDLKLKVKNAKHETRKYMWIYSITGYFFSLFFTIFIYGFFIDSNVFSMGPSYTCFLSFQLHYFLITFIETVFVVSGLLIVYFLNLEKIKRVYKNKNNYEYIIDCINITKKYLVAYIICLIIEYMNMICYYVADHIEFIRHLVPIFAILYSFVSSAFPSIVILPWAFIVYRKSMKNQKFTEYIEQESNIRKKLNDIENEELYSTRQKFVCRMKRDNEFSTQLIEYLSIGIYKEFTGKATRNDNTKKYDNPHLFSKIIRILKKIITFQFLFENPEVEQYYDTQEDLRASLIECPPSIAYKLNLFDKSRIRVECRKSNTFFLPLDIKKEIETFNPKIHDIHETHEMFGIPQIQLQQKDSPKEILQNPVVSSEPTKDFQSSEPSKAEEVPKDEICDKNEKFDKNEEKDQKEQKEKDSPQKMNSDKNLNSLVVHKDKNKNNDKDKDSFKNDLEVKVEENYMDNPRNYGNQAITFISYAPRVFENLRKLYSIKNKDIADLFGPSEIRNLELYYEKFIDGKCYIIPRGAVLMLISISDYELECLKHILFRYYCYFVNNSNTFLLPILGCFSIKIADKIENTYSNFILSINRNPIHELFSKLSPNIPLKEFEKIVQNDMQEFAPQNNQIPDYLQFVQYLHSFHFTNYLLNGGIGKRTQFRRSSSVDEMNFANLNVLEQCTDIDFNELVYNLHLLPAQVNELKDQFKHDFKMLTLKHMVDYYIDLIIFDFLLPLNLSNLHENLKLPSLNLNQKGGIMISDNINNINSESFGKQDLAVNNSKKESLVIKEFRSDTREIMIIEYKSEKEILIFHVVNDSDIKEIKQFERAYESSFVLKTHQHENSNHNHNFNSNSNLSFHLNSKPNSSNQLMTLKSRNIIVNFESIIITESIEDFNIESFRNAENQNDNPSLKLNEKNA